jgi:hypothetical protein
LEHSSITHLTLMSSNLCWTMETSFDSLISNNQPKENEGVTLSFDHPCVRSRWRSRR